MRISMSITAVIAVVLLLIVGTGATSILSTTYTLSATWGDPFFVEKGKSTVQKEIGLNRTQYTFTASGMMNGNIEVTDTGEFVSVSKNNLIFDQEQGVIKTKDGSSESANYTLIDVSNGTAFQGASAYSTNSTGKLSFLNNIIGIYRRDRREWKLWKYKMALEVVV